MPRMSLQEMLKIPKEGLVLAYTTMTGKELLVWKIERLKVRIHDIVHSGTWMHSQELMDLRYIQKSLEHFEANLKEVLDGDS